MHVTQYLHFSEIHKGDVLFEEGFVSCVQVRVLDEPVLSGDQWTFNGETALGTTVRYLMTEGFSHYGPRLSHEPTRPTQHVFNDQ